MLHNPVQVPPYAVGLLQLVNVPPVGVDGSLVQPAPRSNNMGLFKLCQVEFLASFKPCHVVRLRVRVFWGQEGGGGVCSDTQYQYYRVLATSTVVPRVGSYMEPSTNCNTVIGQMTAVD